MIQIFPMFARVIRFWLDHGAAGLRVDVAHGLFKDPDLPDDPAPDLTYHVDMPTPYRHRPEVHDIYRSWRKILDSYTPTAFPGARTAIGEVWYDSPATLRPYLAPDGLLSGLQLPADRGGLERRLVPRRDRRGARAGRRIACAVGHREPRRTPRPVSRYQLDEGYTPQTINRLVTLGQARAEVGVRRARVAALALAGPARIGLHLPGRGTRPARSPGHPRQRAPGPPIP